MYGIYHLLRKNSLLAPAAPEGSHRLTIVDVVIQKGVVMVNKVARIVLLFGLMLGFGPLYASALPILSIEPPSKTVQPGQHFSLNAFITDVTDLFAFEFDLAFDPTVLSTISVIEGPFLPGGGSTFFVPGSIDNTVGTITLTSGTLIGPIPGVSGSGILATINFQALALGTSPVTLSNVLLLDSNLADITASTADGTVSAVPEPSTLILLITGILGTVGHGWYRRKQA
jgi:general secretion pathway protein D